MFRIIPHRVFIEPKASVKSVDGVGEDRTATLRIEGLLCSACAANTRRSLEAVAGVRDARVDLERGEAQVSYDSNRTEPAALTAAVQRAMVLRPARRWLAALGRRPADTPRTH